jgi:uncharacterized membrane protein YphA (DoxX/SURF4 family)
MRWNSTPGVAMLLGLIFLLWPGPGRWSIDGWLTRGQRLRSSAMNP